MKPKIERDKAADGPEVKLIRFFQQWPEGRYSEACLLYREISDGTPFGYWKAINR